MTLTHELPFVSILVINYQGERHLNDCLGALKTQTYPRYLYEVIVLDNNSTDRSIQILEKHHTWCHTIPMKHNFGFAQGNNLAASAAHGSWYLLLNNDTIPDSHLLVELFDSMSVCTTARVAKLVFSHDPKTLNSTGSYLLRDGRGADRGFRRRDQGSYEKSEPVFAGCGAALAMRAVGIEENIFDPSYFVYYEDTQHCWLRRLNNQHIHYQPRAIVRHTHGAAAGDRSMIFHYYVERNKALTALRCGDLALAIYTAIVLIAKTMRSVSQLRKNRRLTLTLAAALISYLTLVPKQLINRMAARYRFKETT